jgi:methyl-accepting chemotaxis protein
VEQSAAAAESLKQQAQQLVQAVAVFRLGHGERPLAAAASPTPVATTAEGYAGPERRGPNRARNVSRLHPKAAPARQAQSTHEPEATTARNGTDDEWTSF